MTDFTWHGWLQYDGDGVSIFRHLEFPVSGELYRRIQEAIAAGTRLSRCPFYGELLELLENAFDRDEYLGIEKPDPDGYDLEDEDGKEAYQEELECYREERERFDDDFILASEKVYDPADEREFRKSLIGRHSPILEDEGEGEYDFEYSEDCDRIVNYSLTVVYDENGVITDIRDIEADGMEWMGVTRSGWDSCSPDYGLLADALEEELELGPEEEREE